MKYFNFFLSLIKNFYFRRKIFYIIEYVKWANYNDAINLKKYFKDDLIISNEIYGIKKSIIHIGTHYKLFSKNKFKNIHESNKIIVFWPHLDRKNYIAPFLKKNISKFLKINTCCLITKKNLIKYGIPRKKIVHTPLSVDTKIFDKVDRIRQYNLKEKFFIPNNKLILGSFVKDGVGFQNGNNPKKIKNPQMLVRALKDFKYKKDLFFVLSGPARGYLKEELNKIGIGYYHKNCSTYKELSELYKLIDVTIINSNLEGGPHSLLESLASGVPVLSTKVGMSPELIKDNFNGYLFSVNDHRALANKLKYLLSNRKKLNILKSNARKSIKNYSTEKIGKNYFKKMYKLI